MPTRVDSPGSRALRRGRASIPGQLYLLTTIANARRPHFRDWLVASKVCETLCEPALWRDSQLLCWVLMPDHLHALVALGENEPLHRLVQRVKAVTSRQAKTQRPGHFDGAIWMSGYHDRALRREESAMSVARYIVCNPVRAGLVRRVGDYPFWDALWV